MQAGNNLEDIKNEVEKLASYAGKSDLITRKQSIAYHSVSGIYGFPVYRCSIGQRKATALEQMEILLEQEQSVFGILALIARQLKIMLLCKSYDEMGYNLTQIQKQA